MNCEQCGSEMVQRKGSKGPFWGCMGFPACTNTKPIKEEQKFPVVSPGQAVKTQPQVSNKEFHLSPEEVRCRALECALEMWKTEPKSNIIELAEDFVSWINS